jgi:hypothetical protein
LSVWRKRLEDEFLIEASDQFRAKEFVELGNHSPLERGEWEPGRTKKLLRADVAGANDVKARKIIRTMIAEWIRAASSICKNRSDIRRWAFSISSKSRTP